MYSYSVPRRTPDQLRSHRWFGPDDLRSFGHRSRQKQQGIGSDEFSGKPVIGILNTWNEFNTCHAHFPERAAAIKRGVWKRVATPSDTGCQFE